MRACETRDADLALHVREDLPEPGRHELEGHLERCPRCRGVLGELAAVEDALQSLAEQALPETALNTMRSRVLAAARRSEAPARGEWVPWWAAAAAAIVGIGLAVAWLAWTWAARPAAPAGPVVASGAPIPPPVVEMEPRPHEPGPDGSSRPTVPATLARTNATPPPSAAPPSTPSGVEPAPPEGPERLEAASNLTPEEADQLARAVLAMARIEKLGVARDEVDGTPDAVPGPSPATTGDVVQWTLSDPDVVIYWLLDSKGDGS